MPRSTHHCLGTLKDLLSTISPRKRTRRISVVARRRARVAKREITTALDALARNRRGEDRDADLFGVAYRAFRRAFRTN